MAIKKLIPNFLWHFIQIVFHLCNVMNPNIQPFLANCFLAKNVFITEEAGISLLSSWLTENTVGYLKNAVLPSYPVAPYRHIL